MAWILSGILYLFGNHVCFQFFGRKTQYSFAIDNDICLLQVMKKAGTLRIPSMSCKAFNGRVVLEYLADCSRLAARGSPATGQGRNFGGWLTREVRAGNALYSDDPKIPLQAVAMKLVRPLLQHRFLRGSIVLPFDL